MTYIEILLEDACLGPGLSSTSALNKIKDCTTTVVTISI